MKKALLLMSFFFGVACANAQRWGNHHHQFPQPYYGGSCHSPRVVIAPPRPVSCGFGNNYGRRPFINVVIAPRPRVVNAPDPVYNQPNVERIWVEGHYEQTDYGRIWVEGHYIQREMY